MAQNYNIGSIQATNVAVGDHATARSSDAEYARIQALQELQRFIALLPDYVHMVGEPHEVQANARAAEAALSEKSPNRGRIENLVSKMALGVAGVTALANAATAVQAAITHLFS